MGTILKWIAIPVVRYLLTGLLAIGLWSSVKGVWTGYWDGRATIEALEQTVKDKEAVIEEAKERKEKVDEVGRNLKQKLILEQRQAVKREKRLKRIEAENADSKELIEQCRIATETLDITIIE